MHRLQFELTGECPQNPLAAIRSAKAHGEVKQLAPICIWFEAWRYQHESAPIVALLQEMRGQFGRIVEAVNQIRKLASTSKDAALALLEKSPGVISMLAKAGLAVTSPASLLDPVCMSALEAFENVGGKIAKAVGTVRDIGERYEKENFRVPLQTHQLREQLDHAVGQLLGGLIPKQKKKPDELAAQNARRVVVFIDDLDRCEPKTAYRLLEGIKIYLNLHNCVFVLGVNRDELIRIIADGLPGKEQADSFRAQEYLEKLCGHCVALPDCTNVSQRKLVNQLIKVDEANIVSSVAELAETPGFLPANPRRIKAFCNTAARLLLRRVARATETPMKDSLTEARALALVASLAQFHPELFDAFRRYTGFLAQMTSFCTGAGDTKSKGLHPAFEKLTLPVVGKAPDDAATPSTSLTWDQTFADIASLNVFHAQQLLFNNHFGDAEITEDLIYAYLD